MKIKAAILVANNAPLELAEIETPDRLCLTINMATANAIGLNIPRKILARADHLVE